jgi:peptide/nickel transport system permease protein
VSVAPTTDAVAVARDRSRAAGRRGLALRDPGLTLALVLLAVIVLIAVAGPPVWTIDPRRADIGNALLAPSWSHPMGTDGSGRDILARFAAGARISLLAGLAVVAVGALAGIPLGVIAGLGRGLTDNVLMRLLDAILAFPPLILAMTVSLGLGAGLTSAVIGIALSSVPFFARLVRGDVLRIREQPHIEAARAIGVPQREIVWRHILPHTAPTMLVQSAAVFGFAILTLAGLGFVGLGAQIPSPEWGAMITDGQEQIVTGQWWVAVFPGLGVLLVVVAANVLSDRLRERLDPRATGRGR